MMKPVITYASCVVSNVKVTVKFSGAIALSAIVEPLTCKLEMSNNRQL